MKARREFVCVCVNTRTHTSTCRDHLVLLYLTEAEGGVGSHPGVCISGPVLLISSFPSSREG